MQGLVGQGHQVTVLGFQELNRYPIQGVVYQSLGSNQSKIKLMLTSLKIALKHGGIGTFFKTIVSIFKGNKRYLQAQNLEFVFKTIQPDVVHVQWPSLLPWLEPHLENPDFKVVLSQRGFHINVRPFVDAENRVYLQHLYPKLDGLHSVSQAISQKGNNIGTPKNGVDTVVYTGIDLERVPYTARTKQEGVIQLLSVGRPHWIKDYPTAIKACAVLKAKGVDFHYTIIGGAGHEELLFLIHELGLNTYVTLSGKMSQEAVYNQMRGADVLLVSSAEEGLPNVAVEAMALGTPVVSTDCGGVSELVEDDVTGWLVPVADAKAMAEAIMEVKTLDLEDLNVLTRRARIKVEQQHRVEDMVDGMITLYNSVL
ncbi:glycosyltransferase [Aestuariibaculum marinum]|uniref:Glycosyltransferase n=2 Tax=Aestuariibaculum marinum TaxID=2683592 RepID=A0A8J6UB57_9FLAO|nr:glycosyltransferase [Aestuariibaculum marinum]